MEVNFAKVDVNEYKKRVERKIVALSRTLIPKIGFSSCLCEAKDIFILSQSIEVIDDNLTSQECIDAIISRLSEKYCLQDIYIPEGSGIGTFRIDNNEDCTVFKIYR